MPKAMPRKSKGGKQSVGAPKALLEHEKRERHKGKRAVILWDEAEPIGVSKSGTADRSARVSHTDAAKPGNRAKEL